MITKILNSALAKPSPEEATLELSYAADRALRAGDLDFLKALFDAVEKADFPDRVVRGLLINTRDAGLSIESRDRRIERVCNNSKKDLRERLR